MIISNIFAEVLIEIITNEFTQNPEVKQKFLRIKNFQPTDLIPLLKLWEAEASKRNLGNVRLVVANDLGGNVASKYVAEVGRSITFYRNHNTSGLVYLETTTQTDEQGLQNLFTFRDSNLLDGSFDTYAGQDISIPSLIANKSWLLISKKNERMPALVLEKCLQVLNYIHPKITIVPGRNFARFCSEVSMLCQASKNAIDSDSSDQIIGQALWCLDMFPDEFWRLNESDARIHRRFELNFNHAELMSGGTELDVAKVIDLIEAFSFHDENGVVYKEVENTSLKKLCTHYLQHSTETIRKKIPYFVFQQLFQRDTAGLPLGDRARTEIENNHLNRLSEFDSAGVVHGLNERLREDAEKFLALESSVGEPPLFTLLTTRTRRAIEQLVTTSMPKFFNPAIELMRVFQRTRDIQGVSDYRIKITPIFDLSEEPHSLGLFVFLFGNLVNEISEILSDGAGEFTLVVDKNLITPRKIPELQRQKENELSLDSENKEPSWNPLLIKFEVYKVDGNQDEVIEITERLWAPGNEDAEYLQFFWLLTCANDSNLWTNFGGLFLDDSSNLQEWVTSFVSRTLPLTQLNFPALALNPTENDFKVRLLEIQNELKNNIQKSGLNISSINEFLDVWQTLLRKIREDFVPNGTRSVLLEGFLQSHTVTVGSSARRLMLPTHPLRLRWIARYLKESLNLAIDLFTSKADFAFDDGEQYLEWLESRSPHETPPIAMGNSGEIIFAKSELGWFEDFAPLSTLTADVSVDGLALTAITRKLSSYIDAHPYKKDGLSLLLLFPSADTMPAELIGQLEKRIQGNFRLQLTVVAPRERWTKIAKYLDDLALDDRGKQDGRLFPSHDLSFIEVDDAKDLANQLLGHSFDVAIVTHILQERVSMQQNTEPPLEIPGEFNPLLDRPLRLTSEGDDGAMSIVMRPRYPDELLESWGTLVVRAERTRPISSTQPENIDFVELSINFQDSAQIFNALHNSAHWVITLERHISREQIESNEAGSPDVLSIESGVGANGLSVLIVSSSSGRNLIESRIARKLQRITGSTEVQPTYITNLAKHVYEETRKSSPHLALKAMGVARVTEEILGMCIARSVADKFNQLEIQDGLSAWISLDEHSDWFGGASAVRADLCRISINRTDDGNFVIDVLVLEGKFRQVFDPYGIEQVRKTKEFFELVLGKASSKGSLSIDAHLWRERIIGAIENISPDVRKIFSKNEVLTNATNLIPAEISNSLRSGHFELGSVVGLYSCCLWDSNDDELIRDFDQGIYIVKSTKKHILQLIKSESTENNSILPIQISIVNGAGEGNDIQSIPAQDSSLENLFQISAGGVMTSTELVRNNVTRAHLDADTLKKRYEEILACFMAHSVKVNAVPIVLDPYIEGPASILFKVKAGIGVDPRKLFDKAQALKLRLELAENQHLSFQIDRGFVTIDVPKPPNERYYVDAGALWKRWQKAENELCVPIGEDRFGELVSINFSSSNCPHLLIAGTTGSGKSEALNAILFGLVHFYSPKELKLLLVDPKGTEMLPLEHAPHLEGGIGWDDQDAISLLEKAVEEMQKRYTIFKNAKKRTLTDFNSSVEEENRMPWWLIVLDEYADLTSDTQAKRDIESLLKRLAQKARAAGIHVVIATQKPSAEVISTNLRSNLPAQLALKVKSSIESRVVLDEAGAETLNGKGDALLKAESKVIRVQCALVSTEDQVVNH